MLTGLSAFSLTPLVKGEIDENAFVALIEALAAAGVNSIGALGSTGSYAYLTREQRFAATRLAVSAAAGVPVMTSIGSVNAEEIVRLGEDAQKAGVSGLLLAPLCYQKLTAEEVFRLYERLCGEISVPLCIYDNPATSGFEFNDELLEALSFLPNMGSIKLGDLPADPADALARVAKLKSQVAAGVTIGISGDAQSAAGLLAGCDVWYSVLAGLFPDYCLRLTQAALQGDVEETRRLNGALEPLWGFFRRYGSLRVIATMAELRGRAAAPCLPFPLQTLAGAERDALQEVAERVL
ncbi:MULTISPECIES: dihydrodipicolinate synthase family protein [Leclercia]|uniref:dihydrodipicolinate synthase family protein n=1 Tax=Leclercia TaxID=83654 RepID=UPI0012E7220E|nr:MULTISPECIES: dihydrodipicolinate synthase family protein [Leclercia]QGW17208.1 dihydrodipicolinate synthase family protein [Leclercia sp. Colony189]URM20931.1 dihydrodipicolinate synthase family protein [Leclercia adecarboxylata]